MASSGALAADRDVIASSPASPRPGPPPDTSDPADPGLLTWSTCDGFGIPDADDLGTSRWECARLDAPMDPTDPDGATVSLALTRHPATGDRVGSLLLNPGGPGGAGLPLAWNIRSAMPPELLRSFDMVSWDPRGVGQSEPAIACPSDLVPDDPDFIAGCVEATGDLAGFLSAPYSAMDLEAIRVALGEERLHYLGYSYGSVIGATYAERFPDRVAALVLDGVTDPDVGSIDGPFSSGFPNFADDGLPAALARFEELCAVTEQCLGADGRLGDADAIGAELDRIVDDADELDTPDHAGEPERLTPPLVDDHLALSMSSAAEWELLGAALADASTGDGSNLAAHIDSSDFDAAPSTEPNDGSAPDNFEAANLMIYCADFGPLITQWSFCEAMPPSADPLVPIEPVDLDWPILVIGAEYDPLTPGYHAPEFADRLGDATWMIWDGVGHTAFPGWTRCIDDAVVDHLLRLASPTAGTRCDFADGVADDAELADQLFGFDVRDGRPWLQAALDDRGRVEPALIECVVAAIVPDDDVDDEVVAELILGVTSAEAEAALASAVAGC